MTSIQSSPICDDERPITEQRVPRLHKFLRAMAKENASDLHFQADCVPHIRVRSKIVPVRGESLTGDEIFNMVQEILTDKQMEFFLDNGSVDISEQPKDCDRFRINIFRQRGEVSIAVRRVLREIPTFGDLHLPAAIARIVEYHAGLVLVAGITGSGKSTTIAAA